MPKENITPAMLAETKRATDAGEVIVFGSKVHAMFVEKINRVEELELLLQGAQALLGGEEVDQDTKDAIIEAIDEALGTGGDDD